MTNYKYILVDGSSLLHRSSHTKGEMTTKMNGRDVPISGTYHFIGGIIRLYQQHGMSHMGTRTRLIVAWEGGPESRRKEAYPKYKDRKRDDGFRQFYESCLSTTKAMLSELGVPQMYSPEWEADDTLATLAARLSKKSNVLIHSNDKDLHQNASERVHIVNHAGEVRRLNDIRELWGVGPEAIPYIKGIAGDSSDTIPGVPGLGEKAALEIVQHQKDIANWNYDPKSYPSHLQKKAEKLLEYRSDFELFCWMCSANKQAPIEIIERAGEDAVSVLKKYKFASYLDKMSVSAIQRMTA